MKRRMWSNEEIETLINCWGKEDVEMIANLLNRTEKSIHVKASRLNLGSQIEGYTPLEIANILGLSKQVIAKYMREGKIKHKRDKSGQRRYMANELQVKQFMKNYQDLWSTEKVNINLYKNKPTWYKEKEIKDRRENIKKGVSWSDVEVKILIDRHRRSWSLAEISKELSRSEASIKNKLVKVDYGRNIRL
jgi:DNA-binding transcriptional MerR regulator